MRGFLSHKRGRLSASLGLSVGISVATSLCAGALLVGPLATPVLAAPTLGGDENGPQVQILQPSNQDVLKGTTKILIVVKSQKFSPQFVEMFVDDKPAAPGPLPFSALPSAQYDWPTKFLTDGPHKLMVRVTDTQGFRGWAEVNVFVNNQKKIDTTPPSLKWQNTKSFQQLSGTTSIRLDALDNFGVKWLFISLTDASDPSKKLRNWMLNRPPYEVKLDTTQVPDGVYNLRAKAYDSFEQEGEAPALTLGIVNSAINATTVGDMLDGLQRIENSNQKPTPPAKPGRKFTLDTPDSARSTSPLAPLAPRSTQKSGLAQPKIAKSAAPKTKPAGLSARALPPMNVSALPPVVSKPVVSKPVVLTPKKTANPIQVAKLAPLDSKSVETAEVAAPQFSGRSTAQAPISRSKFETEIGGAVGEDWRARFARAASPDAAPRSEQEISLPLQNAGPRLSERDSFEISRRAVAAPLKVEIENEVENTTLGGRLSAPQLMARADAATVDASMPQISAPAPATATKISARQAIADKLAALKTPRASKGATPRAPRLAALPRPTKNEARGAISAITVSPLQINVSQALPAFHVAARASDLRAVAARYGLPVEVIAANNGWKADKTLSAGERVNLPKQLKVAYQGVPVASDAPSMLVGGTGVTAFRFLFEQAGGKLNWDAKKQRVVARKGNSEVVLSIGSNRAKVGDKDVMLELAAFLFEGRTMVPVRFFEAGLRAQVEWDPQTGRLVVAMAG